MKSRIASIRALQELRCLVESRMSAKFDPLLRNASSKCNEEKKKISSSIEKEIEQYAVEKYKEFGMVVVPVCQRSTSYKDENLVRCELRIKNYDKSSELAVEMIEEERKKAKDKLDEWYFLALQAVASQVDLPPTPEF